MKKLFIVLLAMVFMLTGCRTIDTDVLEDMIAQCHDDPECVAIIQREYDNLEEDRKLREEVYNAFIEEADAWLLDYMNENSEFSVLFEAGVWGEEFKGNDSTIYVSFEVSPSVELRWQRFYGGEITQEQIDRLNAFREEHVIVVMEHMNELVMPFNTTFVLAEWDCPEDGDCVVVN